MKRSSWPRKKKNWKLLLLEDRGRIVVIRHFRTGLVIAVVFFVLSIIVAAGLTLGIRLVLKENESLARRLDEANRKVASAAFVNTVLKAKLLLAQKRTARQEKYPESDLKNQKGAAALKKQDEPFVLPVDKVKSGEREETEDRIIISDPLVSRRALLESGRFTFALKNRNKERLAGYAFVILEGKKKGGVRIPIPAAEIHDGMPIPFSRGQFFSIANFKTMRFPLAGAGKLDRFDGITILVFNSKGGLLLKKSLTFVP